MMKEEQHNSDQISPKAHQYQSRSEIIPSHWSEGTVMANGIHQHYYRTGGEKPTLILLHGFSENGLGLPPGTTPGSPGTRHSEPKHQKNALRPPSSSCHREQVTGPKKN